MSDKRELSSLIRLFICTDRMHKSFVDRCISELGIHRSQHMILMHLASSGELPSQKELAEHLDVSPAAVAVALKTLEGDGYIKKESVENDSRLKKIVITDKGKVTVEKSRAIFSAIDTAMCSGLSDEELDNMRIYLEKMREGLKSLKVGENQL